MYTPSAQVERHPAEPRRGYRPGAPVLSLAHAMRAASPVLQVAAPWVRSVAMELRINVGLAVPDGDEMVYLEFPPDN